MITMSNNKQHVKFISYTGAYPNLCSGILTLEIDGKECTFGNEYWTKKSCTYPQFWHPGGCVYFDNDYCEHVEIEPWYIVEEELPEELKKYAYDMIDVFNDNVPYGCCGGCV